MIDFTEFDSLFALTLYFNSEDKCKQTIIESRWKDGDIVCPFCGKHHCYHRSDGSFRCPVCEKNFSCLVGTIFENTKISLRKWFMAMYLISTHKKGVSSVQLSVDIDVTQKTAWFILHKLRTLFANYNNAELSDVVQCDEMYLGGRETNKHESKRTEKTQGRSIKTKTPIFGMATSWYEEEINHVTGEVVKTKYSIVNARKVANAKAETLIPIIEKYIAEGSLIVTDELSAYCSIDRSKYKHMVVRHGAKEYVINGFTTNGIEGYWGHFKRTIFGIYHMVSKKYLQRYIDESVYRYNTKGYPASWRFQDMFNASIGRVQYEDVKHMVA